MHFQFFIGNNATNSAPQRLSIGVRLYQTNPEGTGSNAAERLFGIIVFDRGYSGTVTHNELYLSD